MIKILLAITSLILLSSKAFAQTDPCITTNKKEKKAIEAIQKEVDFDNANVLLKEAIKKIW